MGFTDDDWVDPKVASERLVDSVIAWGDVDEIAARVRAHHDAGADHVAIQVLRCDRELPTTEWCELAPALIGG
jgi:hypothetical protein